MLEITTRNFIFKKKNIWFSEYPFDIPDCSAVFFYACKNSVNREDFIKEETPTIIIDLHQEIEAIWKKMDQKSCRYMINKGKKLGIEVKKNTDIHDFIKLYLRFVKEKKFESSPEALDIMKKGYGTFFTAYLNGEMLCGMMTVEDEKISRWLVGASKRLEVEKEKSIVVGSANRLMIWEAILDAKARGREIFDLGGYYGGDDKNDPRYSIASFKRSFGGEIVMYYKYKKYYSTIYKIGKYLSRCWKHPKVF